MLTAAGLGVAPPRRRAAAPWTKDAECVRRELRRLLPTPAATDSDAAADSAANSDADASPGGRWVAPAAGLQ